MRKKFAAAGLVAGLAGGGAAGFALTSTTGLVGAQTATTTTAPAPSDTKPATGETARPDRAAFLEDALAGLVKDGTITQAQADKVISAIQAAAPKRGEGGPGKGEAGRGFGRGGHGGPGMGGHGGHGGQGLTAAAEALGLTEDELRTELREGATIAEIATTQKVDVDTVIDAMVAEAKTRLDARVKDGSMTQSDADARLKDITTRITERVNNAKPESK